MGCTHHKQQINQLVPCKTINGLLKVTIQQANIYKHSKISSTDAFLRITMSNQEFKGYIHKKAGRSSVFNQSFQFVINSRFKPQGRSMAIELWNKSMLNDKVIGLGIIDIDPIISFEDNAMMGSKLISVTKQNQYMQQQQPLIGQTRKSQCKMKVFLNHAVEEVGYLNTVFQFFQQPVTTIGFKFIYASLRRTSSFFTTMYCNVQAIVGQQILQTQKQKDRDTKDPPSWQDEILVFNIPKSVKHCMIRVLDGEKQLGHVRCYLGDILNKKGQYFFTQQLQHERAISGVIKYCVMVGAQQVGSGSRKESRFGIQQQIIKVQPNEQNPMKTQLQDQQAGYRQMKRQLPSQKSTRMQESEFRTVEYTQPNEEQAAREQQNISPIRQLLKEHKIEQSIVIINGQQVKP